MRALHTEAHTDEREIIFSVKFYHLSPLKSSRVPNKREEKGLQNAFFSYEECASRDVCDDLFERE